MAEVIHGIKFRKIEASSPVEEVLREISIDVEQAGEDAKGAEIFAVVRYADGTFDMWATATISAVTRVGELEAIKAHLLMGMSTEELP